MGEKWKGADYIDSEGYHYISLERNDPLYSMTNNGCIQEHRLIMARYLGRILNHKETVHHINRIKDDNRIGNLILYSSSKEHMLTSHKFTKSKYSDKVINKIKSLYLCGLTMHQIAHSLHKKCSNISIVLTELGIKRSKYLFEKGYTPWNKGRHYPHS